MNHSFADRLLYVCNTAGALAKFRMPLLMAAMSDGYRVACASGAGIASEQYISQLRERGIEVYPIAGLERTGGRPSELVRQAISISRVVDVVRPTILHSFTHRANVASFLALLVKPGVRFFPNVTGAGRLFEDDIKPKERIAQKILLQMYHLLAKRSENIFFQNEDDAREFAKKASIAPSRIAVTGGSGFDPAEVPPMVDAGEFRQRLYSVYGVDPNKALYLLPTRALRSKGVQEFYDASRRYLELFDDAVFVHAGEGDIGARDGYSARRLAEMQLRDLRYIGFQQDICQLMNAAKVVVLPSYYREGVPRSLIEALYFGKVVITTDTPGCREAVIDNWNGRLVPARSANSLLGALVACRSIDVAAASSHSRLLFECRFHASRVTSKYLRHYRSELSAAGSTCGRDL